ncbi:site-specific integrase [Acidobacteria bacterium AH-259-O06]|nr:site-specific integrase [Acidobacteria bacterium AH-259-O06]
MGSVYKRGTTWWVKYYRAGKAFRESSGSRKESDAKRLLRLREGDIVRGVPVTPRVGRVKFDELAEDVLTDYRINGKRSLIHAETRFRLHLLPFFGGRRAAAITPADANRFTLKRQENGASNGEINRELAMLKRAFNLGIQTGKMMTRPHVAMLNENNVRSGFFERDQFEAVKRHLREYLKPFVMFAYITGWRKSEITSLEWHQLDFSVGRVYLEPGNTKNDDARWFPFTEELRQLLERQREETDRLQREKGTVIQWVFHREGKRIGDFRKSWKTACRKAGLPGRIPHDFRRTAVRNLVRAGVPERVAMQMTGHKTRSVFERYNIVSEEDLAEAARRLSKFSRTV